MVENSPEVMKGTKVFVDRRKPSSTHMCREGKKGLSHSSTRDWGVGLVAECLLSTFETLGSFPRARVAEEEHSLSFCIVL